MKCLDLCRWTVSGCGELCVLSLEDDWIGQHQAKMHFSRTEAFDEHDEI